MEQAPSPFRSGRLRGLRPSAASSGSARHARSGIVLGAALVGVLVGAGLTASPAQALSPLPAGERIERCVRAEPHAQGVLTLARGFRAHVAQARIINPRMQQEIRDLNRIIAAPKNRALAEGIRQLSIEIADPSSSGRRSALLDVLETKSEQLLTNITTRKEFTIADVDANGQPLSRTTAC